MDYTPRAENVRLTAAAAYLPLVAIVLLLQPQFRDVRLVRFHSYQALGLGGAVAAGLFAANGLSQLLSAMPGVGFLLNLAFGLFMVGLMLGAIGIAFYGAYQAFQGNYTRIPILTDWCWSLINGTDATREAEAIVPPRPRRRRRPAEPEGGDETY